MTKLTILTGTTVAAALLWGVSQGHAAYVPPPVLVPGVNYNIANFANSPVLTKFVEPLPGVKQAGAAVPGWYNSGAQDIPIAVAETSLPTGVPADAAYYEIALVEYTATFHSELGPTKQRGYVQIHPPGSVSGGTQLYYLTGLTPDTTKPIQVNIGTVAVPNLVNVYAYETTPTYLGPIILATKGVGTRIKFYNLLPTTAQGGNLFIPTDITVDGAGFGPITNAAAANSYMPYSQNRATLHLHGGDNPWISDGTAHQWITPAGEVYAKGASQQNVPDMPAPGAGSATFFWPNGQSGRLMFYHDHAYGITRLNVYAGEAAGYLLVDTTEATINAVAPGGEIPLVIQDKSFVSDGVVPAAFTAAYPTAAAPAATSVVDPLWSDKITNPDAANWAQGRGSLWLPHVYMPNQNPNDLSGANPYGRWDYGQWFWPIFPVTGPLPMTTIIPELFMDTPVVNGKAYPYVSVQPTAYRLRILNACNDRYLNLQLYVADPTILPGSPGYLTEVHMIPAVKVTNIVSGVATFPAAGAYDNNPASTPPVIAYWPDAWIANDTPGMTPNILDGRAGGVPDPSPTLQGPHFIHIGSEGGLMPTAVDMLNTPIGYEQNKRSVTVLNTYDHTLFLGPAERADVIVDFSQFFGKTLILYNDAPAPLPAGDPRSDYYTGNLDMTSQGGAPPTQPGFGPNTRTIMQIRVGGTGAGTGATVAAVQAALDTANLTAGQPPLIVPPNTYARISDTSMTASFMINGVATPKTLPLFPKTIQELFDPIGRMNATLGVEVPFTTATVQTTIPYGFADPATEVIPDDATQLWKITHNGVDTHAIHFHLFNVQVVNRVGWDGAIKPPWPEEIGWKETVKMNPLEDIVVALHAKTPNGSLPAGMKAKIPNNIRPLDPSKPANFVFTGVVDPNGNPVANYNNWSTNFGNEYTWHCHLLGHEENDMMRPVMVAVAPITPTATTVPSNKGMVITWTDPSPDETAYRVQKSTSSTGPWTIIATVPAGTTTFTDTTWKKGSTAFYQVVAVNTVGSGVPNFPSVTAFSAAVTAASAPLGNTAITSLTQAAALASPVVVKWTYSAADQTGFKVERSTSNTFPANGTTLVTGVPTLSGGVYTLNDPSVVLGLKKNTTYYYRVTPQNANGLGLPSNIASLLVHP